MKKICFVVLAFSAFYFPDLLAKPKQVLIIRHAEKPAQGSELDLKGKERSAALAPFFLGTPEMTRFGPPAAIFAGKARLSGAPERSLETVTSLASSLNIQVNDEFPHNEYSQAVIKIMTSPEYQEKTVLIAWQHHFIPDIVKGLGVQNPPKNWPEDAYDRVWVVTFEKEDAPPTFQDVPQRLMYGDSAE